MKIEMSSIAIDKDAAPKSPGAAGPVRGAQGDAFDRAIRNAAPKPNAKPDAKTAGGDAKDAKAPAGADDAAALEDADTAATEPESGAAEATAPRDARDLQSLLGLLVASTAKPGAGKGETGEASPERSAKDAAGEVVAIAASLAEGAVEAEAGPTKGLRLDVLRMETHFEPRQDGMVLVETASAASTAASALLDAKALANGLGGLAGLARTAADAQGTKAAVASPKATDGTASTDEGGEPIRLRFDEALARLGNGAAARGGGEGASRDGSASSQQTLSDLTNRRAYIKGVDAATAATPSTGADPMGLAGQVAGRIVDALGDPTASPASTFAAPGETHLRMRAGGGALKTLTIQLQPEHLGTLEVSMRLSDGKLALELSASQSDTAALLAQDRGTLRKLLEHAGFALDDASITVVAKDPQVAKGGETASGGGTARDPNPGGSQGGDSAGGRPSAGSSGGEPDARRQARQRSADTGTGDRKLGSTYL